MQQDLLHRYLFDKLDVRGELVQIEHAYNEMIANHNYPEPVKALLGELLVATCLLTATLKFEGEIAVQLQGDGPVKYAVINGDDKQNMRGIARMQSEVSGTTVKELVGKGYMVITITPTKGERYQGIVPLEHDTLSKCIESYFEQSEQLKTRLWFATDTTEGKAKACGLFLQVLPVDKQKSINDFTHLEALSDTIKREELLELDANTVLTRLYHEDNPRVFDPQAIIFKCGCSREKTITALVNVGQQALLDDVAENGAVNISCHYCLKEYAFDEQDIKNIFN
ncbi:MULTISPECIES: Hsp33 family molecular chaperone HslO [Pseudoalteromonas]|jgi:molecular chaperone Hsp33|uniref:Hsp33 family molecular chaperone HslO n=1 Tax=Pseudoalteromonas TaxID=53246 RepID=UPI0002CC5C41|nr:MULTISPECIES: Hsp33 family molecular chaperone HslO [Pseudoalteromonas]ENN98123.1 Hsp33-like chaperonin [Pseudoalteromonas agarivorans S816]MDI3247199.1 Hsp33 family molecular chaperone HslO [Pseudoalteromonas agarivorans]TMS64156.1 Hsp33 family molecular chaperone HslO [Pseudoalteromonas sp. S1691]TMS67747.1 Hsp33 family molecular chaperone HslO [Pseudoalteromonas sp. S1731]TMS68509.1 Hsp33 family molecular chaperone HslO [Pseudoalteromonas sp. S1941]|tara:strand:- start:550 stop:1395 length:846 start_codon:yes stop_codon:yes gene_type:complete